MKNAAQSLVETFEMKTDAPVYLPGSTIRGHVRLQTNKSVQCDGVSIEALGEAQCVLDSKPVSTRKYYRQKKTLFGGVYLTEKGEWQDDEIRFDTTAVPEGGRLLVPLSKRDKKCLLQFVASSRDGDHVLGAAHLYPHSLIDNCRSRHRLEMPLTSDGTNVTATAQFSAAWLLTSTGDVHSIQVRDGDDLMRVVAINIFSVSPKDLPQIDTPIDGYYCKLLLESMNPGESGLITMTSLDMKLPFTFKLPENLPTNLDTEQGSSIRYSLKCSMEGNAELPTAVCHFGVVQPIPSSIPALATPRTAQSSRRSWMCRCGSPIKMSTRLDRSGYAPGDLMRIHLKGDNALKVPIEIQIDLVRTHRINLGRKEWRFSRGSSLLSPLSVQKKQKFNFDLEIPFPSVPPTYEGIDDDDPLTWDYQLVVNVEARQSVVLTHCATVVAAALPTELFSEEKGDLVANSKIEKSPRFSKETRVFLGNWRDVVAEEGIEASIRFVSDLDEKPIRANNKFVRGGECVEVPFVSSYPSGRAPLKGRNDAH